MSWDFEKTREARTKAAQAAMDERIRLRQLGLLPPFIKPPRPEPKRRGPRELKPLLAAVLEQPEVESSPFHIEYDRRKKRWLVKNREGVLMRVRYSQDSAEACVAYLVSQLVK